MINDRNFFTIQLFYILSLSLSELYQCYIKIDTETLYIFYMKMRGMFCQYYNVHVRSTSCYCKYVRMYVMYVKLYLTTLASDNYIQLVSTRGVTLIQNVI